MLVKARIFSMDFWILRAFTYNNVKIERLGTFEDMKKPGNKYARRTNMCIQVF